MKTVTLEIVYGTIVDYFNICRLIEAQTACSLLEVLVLSSLFWDRGWGKGQPLNDIVLNQYGDRATAVNQPFHGDGGMGGGTSSFYDKLCKQL